MSARRSALISGASTGIGEATARRLAGSGWRVFAGVRQADDAARFESDAGIEPVMLDVTSDELVGTAVSVVEATVGDAGLDLLVNNAGVAVGGPVECLDLDEWYRQFEVNFFGVVRLTRAALPLLRHAVDPRIVMIGSINSRIGAPLLGPYVASKHALAGLVASMRREFDRGGPIVTLLEPGAVKTEIWPKGVETADRLVSSLPPEALERYGDHIVAQRVNLQGGDKAGIDPDDVAAIIEQSVHQPRPPARRLVGRDAKAGGVLARVLPGRWFEALMSRLQRRALERGDGG